MTFTHLTRALLPILVLALMSAPALASSPAAEDGAHVQWVALGDSYSAGVGGMAAGQPPCLREPDDSYAGQARRIMERNGYAVTFVHAACSGARTADVRTGQIATVTRADLVTVTIGGNDAGFATWLTHCLAFSDCPSSDTVDWDALYRQLVATYVAVRTAMPVNGHLYVLTYPVFYADPAGWPERQCPKEGYGVHLVARRANESSVRLGDTIYWAVREANRQVTAHGRPGNVAFVDVRPQVREEHLDGRTRRIAYDPTGICSTTPEVVQSMNGVVSGSGGQLSDAFHPTRTGYLTMAGILWNHVQGNFPTRS
ncbi:GDSL-type esterase/lipase family protein [Micromonospora purpureochromogenes]|uniref:GDSL-type esterase/lipase family protein n=1 Tax=Micromonospora purpureochromogenes TaxID=47872 RepID=UPI00362AFBE4